MRLNIIFNHLNRLAKPVQGHIPFWLILVLVLVIPLLLTWAYLTFWYTESYVECDRVFWDNIIGSSLLFPFAFILNAGKYVFGLVVFVLSLFVLAFFWYQKYHFIRLSDFPWIINLLFLVFAIFGFASFMYSLDYYGRDKVNELLMNPQNIELNIAANQESLRDALSPSGIAVNPGNINTVLAGSTFSQGKYYEYIKDGPIALFSRDTKLALFDQCTDTIGILVPDKNQSGFTNAVETNVDVKMPVAFQNMTETKIWDDLWKRFNYYIGVLGPLYIFGYVWWVYCFFVISGLWCFFILKAAYRYRFIKVKGRK